LKKTTFAFFAILLALLCGRFWGEISSTLASVRGGGGAASQNGDTNGDGSLDLSDAVHLLTFLFNGGPPPAALAQTDLGARVAALESLVHTCLPDANGDSVPDCAQVERDSDADGTPDSSDCAPLDAAIHPGAPERCDRIDNNCDTLVDEGVSSVPCRRCVDGQEVVDDANIPDDGNPCTIDTCVAGSPSFTFAPDGIECLGGVCRDGVCVAE
jgi:hypothetical protein